MTLDMGYLNMGAFFRFYRSQEQKQQNEVFTVILPSLSRAKYPLKGHTYLSKSEAKSCRLIKE